MTKQMKHFLPPALVCRSYLGDFLELSLGVRIILVLVRVVFLGELEILLLDLRTGGGTSLVTVCLGRGTA